MDQINIIVSIIYASIFTISYRKVGVFPALFWPVTIIIAGIMVYMTVVLGPMPEDTDDSL